MEPKDLPMLVKRCLALTVNILPYQLETVLRQNQLKAVPDNELAKVDSNFLKHYVRGLYLCGQEVAGDWTRGHEILLGLGFVKKERQEGHRVFVRLEWPQDLEVTQ